jgi:glutathione S-transferase
VVIDVLGEQLADRPFFTGSALSLADILLAPQLDMFSEDARVEAPGREISRSCSAGSSE